MKKKTIVTIVLSVLMFLAAGALGVANVFRVDYVTVEASMASEVAEEEAEALQKKLTEAYKGENLLFVSRGIADGVFAEFPYFRITGIRKDFPNRLVIEAAEDAEVYAVASDKGGHAVLSGNGTVLGIREDTKNRVDGGENVLLYGVTATGAQGEFAGDGALRYMISLCKTVDEVLGGIRSNVVSVTKEGSGNVERFILQMREGVKIYVIKPSALTEEKARKLTEAYLSLGVAQRLSGCIVATGDTSVVTEYFEYDLEIE